ncbi:MAG TPA: choice-of-anchor tandem repeat GloVer-containing protein [Bacteroidia bacterium]|nr:choice-of-anchor tandem repeat GloVer-containing protein [Bacteroidia bacterium]
MIFGAVDYGGKNSDGIIYSYDPVSNIETKVYDFNGAQGSYPNNVMLSFDGSLYGGTTYGGTKGLGVLFQYNYYSNAINILVNSDSAIGAVPGGYLVKANNGLLYGMTSTGGTDKSGVIFCYNILKPGTDSVVFDFDTISGYRPDGNLIIDTSTGFLYGLADNGGLYKKGTLFSFNPKNGKDSVLINFDSINGSMPVGSYIVQASNGMIYGMTSAGGSSNDGVLFRYNPKTGQDTVIVNFNGTNGQRPWCNNLIQASDGLLYGMTAQGGTSGNGVLFSLNPLTNVYSLLSTFFGSNGGNPAYGTLVQNPDDSLLYGTTEGGGKYSKGVLFGYNIKTGIETVIHSFSGNPDGENPFFGPTLVKDSLVGINEVFSNNDIRVYPNPSYNIFYFETQNNESAVDIYNVLGEKVYSTFNIQHLTFSIDLSNEPSGIYIYKITDKSGMPIANGKLLKE